MNEARVIKLTEYGDTHMRDAIANGLVSEDLRRDMERTIRDSEYTRRESDRINRRNIELEAVRRHDQRDRLNLYREWLNGKRRLNLSKVFFAVGFIAGAMFASLMIAVAMAVNL